MSSDIEVMLADEDICVLVDYTVTSWGAPETGPSYASGGEPAEPPEFEIDKIVAAEDGNEIEFIWDNLSDKDQLTIEQAIYERLAEGPDDDYDPPEY